jgi:hypothetical protein
MAGGSGASDRQAGPTRRSRPPFRTGKTGYKLIILAKQHLADLVDKFWCYGQL